MAPLLRNKVNIRNVCHNNIIVASQSLSRVHKLDVGT